MNVGPVTCDVCGRHVPLYVVVVFEYSVDDRHMRIEQSSFTYGQVCKRCLDDVVDRVQLGENESRTRAERELRDIEMRLRGLRGD